MMAKTKKEGVKIPTEEELEEEEDRKFWEEQEQKYSKAMDKVWNIVEQKVFDKTPQYKFQKFVKGIAELLKKAGEEEKLLLEDWHNFVRSWIAVDNSRPFPDYWIEEFVEAMEKGEDLEKWIKEYDYPFY